MTNEKTAEALSDADLDAAAGGDADHRKWIEIQSFSQAQSKPKAMTDPGATLANFEEIKVT